MNEDYIIAIVAVVFVVGGLAGYRFRPRHLKVGYYQKKWVELQKLCSHKETWPEAIINADKLLDQALRKKKFSGRSPGERLVSAQRSFSDNDGVWFGHKLRDKMASHPKMKLRERDVKTALVGIRQALKDIGALPDEKPENK